MSPPAPTLLLIPSQPEREAVSLADGPGLVVARCGIGPIVAAAETARRLALASYGRCVLAGLAGTRDEALAPMGALVVGTGVRDEACGVGHGASFRGLAEMGLAGPGQGPPDDAPALLPLVTSFAATLAAVAVAMARDAAFVATGVIGTVAATSADPADAAARRRHAPDVLVEEMEGYAVALACRRAGVPLVIVRSVSNRCGDRDHGQWHFDQALAALRGALPVILHEGVRSASGTPEIRETPESPETGSAP